jgi:hypothetical protein
MDEECAAQDGRSRAARAIRFTARLLTFGEHWHDHGACGGRPVRSDTIRLPYHINYCEACATLYLNKRFKPADAWRLLYRLGIGFDTPGRWRVLYRASAPLGAYVEMWC